MPTPDEIRAARAAVGMTQQQAAGLVHLAARQRWNEFESGTNGMDAARWELFLLLTDQHPALRVVPR